MSSTQPIRALVLSGGGGRGAFHAGVYQYLMSENKKNVDSTHAGPWTPSIVVGTSIGAVNGAAIAQGMTAKELVEVWKKLEEHDVQGIPPGMGRVARWIAQKLFGEIMNANLRQIPRGEATSSIPEEYWPPLPVLPHWLAEKLIGRWINLLDTGPLQKTLYERFKLDEAKLAESDRALIISATKVQTGERILFSNREVFDYKRRKPRRNVFTGITAKRILASCSIPLVYPWTYDADTEAHYWDGALVANTPLGAAFDLMGENMDIPAEVVVVMMTPWWESDQDPPKPAELPNSFGKAITRVLDWMLLASFRETWDMIHKFNDLAELERKEGKPPYRYRLVNPIIVAPRRLINVKRLIDYDGTVSARLIKLGCRATQMAFEKAFPAK